MNIECRLTDISAGVSGQGKLAEELKLGDIIAIIRIFSWAEDVSVNYEQTINRTYRQVVIHSDVTG